MVPADNRVYGKMEAMETKILKKALGSISKTSLHLPHTFWCIPLPLQGNLQLATFVKVYPILFSAFMILSIGFLFANLG